MIDTIVVVVIIVSMCLFILGLLKTWINRNNDNEEDLEEDFYNPEDYH